ncbi:60S ribosomal protein L38-1, putative [Trichomonas vaginalis G3]|uniref:60S ribosomal protein L38-1, putative n=1 Tax=Trichomonas vaginalis (strain ATCC PRA-98 / G3) TaxID=412133 RepID=A2E8L9_TRIV3|nr:ribosomal L38e protein family [Trichomonas vaginalis G3]EAY10958.1 60S ribosomal protein L38-1, putative [Trichomonas vaginalis G3]KAI5530849.1 ribosomal L38e protein family [Trichomonas vaginalis G3]|eukprot:XP_001323181.1 60S ribosomal protein L38-1 [Trichomonas vaginalis G3]
MPKQVLTARQFVERCMAPDAKNVVILRVNDETAKFKLKTTKQLYTLTVKKGELIQQVIDSLPEKFRDTIVDKKKKVDPYFQIDEEQPAENQQQ